MATATATNIVPAATYQAIVGRILYESRKAKFPDQTEFASRVGLSQPTLSRIESGSVNLSIAQLKKLADSLGTSPGEILKRADLATAGLVRRGVQVVVEEDSDKALAFVGGATLAALVLAVFAKK